MLPECILMVSKCFWKNCMEETIMVHLALGGGEGERKVKKDGFICISRKVRCQ